jgi:hypothetical protein
VPLDLPPFSQWRNYFLAERPGDCYPVRDVAAVKECLRMIQEKPVALPRVLVRGWLDARQRPWFTHRPARWTA